VIENLTTSRSAVKKEKRSWGLPSTATATDRRGERRGEPCWAISVLVALRRDLVHRMGRANRSLKTKCSEILPHDAEKAGLEPVMWKKRHFVHQAER